MAEPSLRMLICQADAVDPGWRFVGSSNLLLLGLGRGLEIEEKVIVLITFSCVGEPLDGASRSETS